MRVSAADRTGAAGVPLVRQQALAIVTPSSRMIEFRIQRKLRSPNEILGRHWREKGRERKTWQVTCETALVIAVGVTVAQELLAPGAALYGCRGGVVKAKRRVTVTRLVPRRSAFIRDDDNLRFAVKPILDALKQLGLIYDDAREWCELALPTQDIAPDRGWWTHILVEPVLEEQQACRG